MGRKTWTRERLTVADLQEVTDQTVMVFASASQRGSELPAPTEGMVSYLEDVNRWEGYGPDAAGALAWNVLAYAGPDMMASLQRVAAQNLTNTGWTVLAWDTEVHDPWGLFTSGTFTIKRAGLWDVRTGFSVLANVAGRRGIRVLKNAGASTGVGRMVGSAGAENGVEASGLIRLALNDTLTVEAWQDTGATQSTGASNYAGTHFQARWLAP